MVINGAVMWNLVKTHPVAGVTAVTESGNGHPGSPMQHVFLEMINMQTSLHAICLHETFR